MVIELGEDGKTALDFATATLSAGGRDYAFTDGAFVLEGTRLVWKNPLEATWPDGEEIELSFRARTFSGRYLGASARFVSDYSRDKEPPPPPAPGWAARAPSNVAA